MPPTRAPPSPRGSRSPGQCGSTRGYRIARVVVQATEAPEWSERGVPSALVLDRPELARLYGDRDSALDAEGLDDAEFCGGVAGDVVIQLLELAVPLLVGGAVGGAIGFALGRRAADPRHARRDRPPPAGPSIDLAAPAAWSAGGPAPAAVREAASPPEPAAGRERPTHGKQPPYGSEPPTG